MVQMRGIVCKAQARISCGVKCLLCRSLSGVRATFDQALFRMRPQEGRAVSLFPKVSLGGGGRNDANSIEFAERLRHTHAGFPRRMALCTATDYAPYKRLLWNRRFSSRISSEWLWANEIFSATRQSLFENLFNFVVHLFFPSHPPLLFVS